MNSELTVSLDTSAIEQQVAELKSLLERLPDHFCEPIRQYLANLVDFDLQTESVPAFGTSCFVLSFRSVALAELCATTRRALDSCST